MKRPLLVIIIWTILIGGLYIYMNSRESIVEQLDKQPEISSATYRLVITTSETTEKDSFALTIGNDAAIALSARLNGAEVFRSEEGFQSGKQTIIDDIKGARVGLNELFIEVNPGLMAYDRPMAVRIQLFRSFEEIADKTLWTEPGDKIISTVQFLIPEESSRKEHDH
ncbi:MAG: hypothetical protein AB7V04_06860 [Desulfomonilaceae bacterium]